MENRKTITYVLAGIIAILLLGLFLTIGLNAKNKKSLGAEKITSEKLLSEKMSLEKQLTKLSDDYNTLKDKSNANTKSLADAKTKLDENEKKINSLLGQNRSLSAYKKELSELKKTKDELDKEYSQLKSYNDRLLSQSNDLQNSINALEAEKNNLATKLEKTQLYNTDNFLVTATRGKKEKIVIKACRTKKLNLNFEVPQSLTETISFKIVTPAGTTINPDDKAISWFFPLDSRSFTASLSSITGEFEQSRKVVLNYVSKGKLVKGVYKIQILSNGNNIGNCRIMLR